MVSKKLLLIVIVFLGISCSNQPKNVSQFIQLFESVNSLLISRTIGPALIEVKFVPTELQVAQEIFRQNLAPTKEVYNQLNAAYENTGTFIFSMSSIEENNFKRDLIEQSSGSLHEYSKNLRKATYDLESSFRLITPNDTIHPSIVQHIPNHRVTSKYTYAISFPIDQQINKDELTLEYYDEFFQLGVQRFKFKLTQNDIPKFPFSDENN